MCNLQPKVRKYIDREQILISALIRLFTLNAAETATVYSSVIHVLTATSRVLSTLPFSIHFPQHALKLKNTYIHT